MARILQYLYLVAAALLFLALVLRYEHMQMRERIFYVVMLGLMVALYTLRSRLNRRR